MWKNKIPSRVTFKTQDQHTVTCLKFDSDKILVGSDNAKINVYSTKTGALKATLDGHEGGIWVLESYGNTLVSGSSDSSIRIWDIARAECTQVFQSHASTVRSLQILNPARIRQNSDNTTMVMPQQSLIISGSRDSTIRVWKLPQLGDGKYLPSDPMQEEEDCPYLIRVLAGHRHTVRAVTAWGDTLVSGSYDCTVRVWRISTGEELYALTHESKVFDVALDKRRDRCISGSMDSIIRIWCLNTGGLLYSLTGHSALVNKIDLSNERLVSASADSTLRIWDPVTGQCQGILYGHTGPITCFKQNTENIISGSQREVKIWNTKTAKCDRDILKDLDWVWQISVNTDCCVAAVQRGTQTYIETFDFSKSCGDLSAKKQLDLRSS